MTLATPDSDLPLDEYEREDRCETCAQNEIHEEACSWKFAEKFEVARYQRFWSTAYYIVDRARIDHYVDRAIEKTRALVDRYMADPRVTFPKLSRWLRVTRTAPWFNLWDRLGERGMNEPLMTLLKFKSDTQDHKTLVRYALDIMNCGLRGNGGGTSDELMDAGIVSLLFDDNGLGLSEYDEAYDIAEKLSERKGATQKLTPFVGRFVDKYMGCDCTARRMALIVLSVLVVSSLDNAEVVMSRPGLLESLLVFKDINDKFLGGCEKGECLRALSEHPSLRPRLIDAGIMEAVARHLEFPPKRSWIWAAESLGTLANLAMTEPRARSIEYYRTTVFASIIKPVDMLNQSWNILLHGYGGTCGELEFARLLAVLSSHPDLGSCFTNRRVVEFFIKGFGAYFYNIKDEATQKRSACVADALTNAVVANDEVAVAFTESKDALKRLVELMGSAFLSVKNSFVRLAFAVVSTPQGSQKFIEADGVPPLLSMIESKNDADVTENAFGAIANLVERNPSFMLAHASHLVKYSARALYEADTIDARKQAMRTFIDVIRRTVGTSSVRDVSADSPFVPIAEGGEFWETGRLILDFMALDMVRDDPDFLAAVAAFGAASSYAQKGSAAADVAWRALKIAESYPQDCEFADGTTTISMHVLAARHPTLMPPFTPLIGLNPEIPPGRRRIHLDASPACIDSIQLYLCSGECPKIHLETDVSKTLECLAVAHEHGLLGLQARCEAETVEAVYAYGMIVIEKIEGTVTFVQAPVLRAVCEFVRLEEETKQRALDTKKRVRFDFGSGSGSSSSSSSDERPASGASR